MKHKITFFAVLMMALVVPQSVKAYDFSAVAPSGQTLYYTINGSNVSVVHENSTEPYYTTFPAGDLIIPATVTYRGTTYNVTSISDHAFYRCTGLITVSIANSITFIGDYAFTDCSSMTSVNIPDGVTAINWNTFAGCANLTSITIPNSVISISGGAFMHSGLTSVVIPSSVALFHYNAFCHCTNLTTVYFNAANSVLYGSDYPPFNECPNISTIYFGGNVTNIPGYAFARCTGVTSIYFNTATPPTCGTGCFDDISNDATIYVPCGSYDAYYNTTALFRFTNIQETGCSPAGATIRAEGNNIVVDGDAGNTVTLYDNGGNVLATSTAPSGTPLRFESLANGTYFVKIGVLPVRMKVVVE